MNTEKKILYVENDPASVILLKRILSKEFVFDSANTDKEAIEKVEENQFDLILMDINLNCDMNGEDLMRLLRRIPNTSKIPIFAVTTRAFGNEGERLLDEGFNGYFAKPYDTENLIKSIKFYLKVD